MENIWEVPEVKQKVSAVKSYIDTMLRTKNLFGWRNFIDDLKTDIELEIYKYEDLHRQGKYKANSIGAYCNMAKQGALNYMAYYTAQKRKPMFESVSLDALYEQESSSTLRLQVADKKPDPTDRIAIIDATEREFGEKARIIVEKILNGETVTSAELLVLRTEEFYDFLKAMQVC